MSYELRFMVEVLYKLKRDFGIKAELVWRTNVIPNLDTGKQTVKRDAINIRRCIVLPETQERTFTYALAFIASNKNFTYGGFFDVNRRMLVIDKKDLPSDFEITTDHYFIVNGTRYDVEKATDYHKCWFVGCKQVDNITRYRVVEKHVYHILNIQQEVGDATV